MYRLSMGEVEITDAYDCPRKPKVESLGRMREAIVGKGDDEKGSVIFVEE